MKKKGFTPEEVRKILLKVKTQLRAGEGAVDIKFFVPAPVALYAAPVPPSRPPL